MSANKLYPHHNLLRVPRPLKAMPPKRFFRLLYFDRLYLIEVYFFIFLWDIHQLLVRIILNRHNFVRLIIIANHSRDSIQVSFGRSLSPFHLSKPFPLFQAFDIGALLLNLQQSGCACKLYFIYELFRHFVIPQAFSTEILAV